MFVSPHFRLATVFGCFVPHLDRLLYLNVYQRSFVLRSTKYWSYVLSHHYWSYRPHSAFHLGLGSVNDVSVGLVLSIFVNLVSFSKLKRFTRRYFVVYMSYLVLYFIHVTCYCDLDRAASTSFFTASNRALNALVAVARSTASFLLLVLALFGSSGSCNVGVGVSFLCRFFECSASSALSSCSCLVAFLSFLLFGGQVLVSWFVSLALLHPHGGNSSIPRHLDGSYFFLLEAQGHQVAGHLQLRLVLVSRMYSIGRCRQPGGCITCFRIPLRVRPLTPEVIVRAALVTNQ